MCTFNWFCNNLTKAKLRIKAQNKHNEKYLGYTIHFTLNKKKLNFSLL